MVIIRFPDRKTECKGLGFLMGRFSGRVVKSGEVFVPEDALAALAGKKIPFIIEETDPDKVGSLIRHYFPFAEIKTQTPGSRETL